MPLAFVRSRIAKGTTVHADESANWNDLHSRFEMKRINHEEAYSFNGACTNAAEEFFSRMALCRDRTPPPYRWRLFAPVRSGELWREDYRRMSNGEQINRLAGLALKRGKSADFTGYWQRHVAE